MVLLLDKLGVRAIYSTFSILPRNMLKHVTLGSLNGAGDGRIELPTAVLETAVIPLN
jgi:hypothetical protein